MIGSVVALISATLFSVATATPAWEVENTLWKPPGWFVTGAYPNGWKGNEQGLRVVDLNGDGLSDLIVSRWVSPTEQYKWAAINTGYGFQNAPQWIPPVFFCGGGNYDKGVRFVDLNGDRLTDIVYSETQGSTTWKASYVNTGNGWQSAPQWNLPVTITNNTYNDLGVRFCDLNGDKLTDFVVSRWLASNNYVKTAYLNNGNGWTQAPQFTPPQWIKVQGYSDYGTRLVDMNGDGRADIVSSIWFGSSGGSGNVWINNGNGWTATSAFNPPGWLVNVSDSNTRPILADINGDAQADYVFRNSSGSVKNVYLNRAPGWTQMPANWIPNFLPPTILVAGPAADFDGSNSVGQSALRYLDLNGDGLTDMIFSSWGSGSPQAGLLGKWIDDDNDLLYDGWEVANSLSIASGSGATGEHGKDGDPDLDGVNNLTEFIHNCRPRVADTDGGGVSDAVEIANGTDPRLSADDYTPPAPSTLVAVRLTVGDHSGSHSERYMMSLKAVTGDSRVFRHQSPAFGEIGSGDYLLRKGATYRLMIHHVATTIQNGGPDFDYTALVAPVNPATTIQVSDPDGVLGQHDTGGGAFYAQGKAVTITIP